MSRLSLRESKERGMKSDRFHERSQPTETRAPAPPPRIRRAGHPWLVNPPEARRAFVLMAILGQCRALEPPAAPESGGASPT